MVFLGIIGVGRSVIFSPIIIAPGMEVTMASAHFWLVICAALQTEWDKNLIIDTDDVSGNIVAELVDIYHYQSQQK